MLWDASDLAVGFVAGVVCADVLGKHALIGAAAVAAVAVLFVGWL